MRFRARDGVCIQYEVRGIDGSDEYPYRNDVASLKEAVSIARTYPCIYGDGAATHVYRRYSKHNLAGHHFSGYTHCWRVSVDGHLQPLHLYNRDWPTSRLDPQRYAKSLPPMCYRASTLQGQMVDLASIAEAIGLHEIAKAISDHAHGRMPLPFIGKT